MVDSKIRIAGAFLVGAALVACSFAVSRNTASERLAANATSVTEAPERTYIDVADSNSDGVPDWRDDIQATDPIRVPQGTSTYEAPTTVTGKFAVDFYEDYIHSKTAGPFGTNKDELVKKAVQKLAQKATDELFTQKDISLFPLNDTPTLHAYGNQVASILLSHPNEGDNEAIILQDYMRYHKKERLADLDPIALAYTTMVKDMLAAPVPQKYVKQHLDVTNALNAVREDVRAMQEVDEDALYTLLRMKRYHDDVVGLSLAIKNLFNALYLEKVEWSESEPAGQLTAFTAKNI